MFPTFEHSQVSFQNDEDEYKSNIRFICNRVNLNGFRLYQLKNNKYIDAIIVGSKEQGALSMSNLEADEVQQQKTHRMTLLSAKNRRLQFTRTHQIGQQIGKTLPGLMSLYFC